MAFRRFGAFYARSFEKRPWVTLAVANGTLGAIADTLAQTLERYQKKSSSSPSSVDIVQSLPLKEEPSALKDASKTTAASWDVARTARFFAFGVMMAPLLDKWNRFIEFRFPLRSAVGAATAAGVGSTASKVSLAALAKRVSVDQGLL
jgi:protein Mpv17